MNRISIHRGNVFVAFFMGIFLPCAGFYLVQWLFQLAEAQGMVDAASSSIGSRRFRTTCLIAICINLLPLQVFQRRKENKSVRGLVIATVLLAFVWVIYFYESLFTS
jgi:hypothetical protein